MKQLLAKTCFFSYLSQKFIKSALGFQLFLPHYFPHPFRGSICFSNSADIFPGVRIHSIQISIYALLDRNRAADGNQFTGPWKRRNRIAMKNTCIVDEEETHKEQTSLAGGRFAFPIPTDSIVIQEETHPRTRERANTQ